MLTNFIFTIFTTMFLYNDDLHNAEFYVDEFLQCRVLFLQWRFFTITIFTMMILVMTIFYNDDLLQ